MCQLLVWPDQELARSLSAKSRNRLGHRTVRCQHGEAGSSGPRHDSRNALGTPPALELADGPFIVNPHVVLGRTRTK